jgi:hypothetical protein
MATKGEVAASGLTLNQINDALTRHGRAKADIVRLSIEDLRKLVHGETLDVVPIEARNDAEVKAFAGTKQAMALEARDIFATFCEYVMRDETTGAPIVLRDMHEEMCTTAEREKYLVVEAHPESGKTNLLVIAHVLWSLGRNPNLRLGLLSAARDTAKKNLASIKKYIESSDALHEVFPDLVPGSIWSTESIEVKRTNILKDPSIQTIGVHGQVQGARLDHVYADDVLDPENTRTKALRDDTSKWVRTAVLARCNGMFFLTNSWHPEDFGVELRKERGFFHLCYPIFNPETGACTWPEQWPAWRIEDRKNKIGSLEFTRLFLCKPRDEGAQIFTAESIARCFARGKGYGFVDVLREEEIPEHLGAFVVTGVDLAVTRRMRGAVTSFTTVLVHPNTHRQIISRRSGRWGAKQILANLNEIGENFGGVGVVEDNSAQKYIIEIATELELEMSLTIVPHTTGRNKIDPEFGIDSMAAELDAGRWIFPSGRDGERMTSLEPEMKNLKNDLDVYDPSSHPGDHLMSMWIARTYILRMLRRRRRMRANGGDGGDVQVSVYG